MRPSIQGVLPSVLRIPCFGIDCESEEARELIRMYRLNNNSDNYNDNNDNNNNNNSYYHAKFSFMGLEIVYTQQSY
jgi:hypothetical protein